MAVCWRQDGRDVRIAVSDYLADAPCEVLRDIASAVCDRIDGGPFEYPRSYLDHVRSGGFAASKRPVYIARSRNLRCTDAGCCDSLQDSVQRLIDTGLLSGSDTEDSYISWTKGSPVRRVGFCNTLFRVVGISSALDSYGIPDFVRDYVVYHECLHLRQGFRTDRGPHDRQFRSWESEFPLRSEAEAVLRKLPCLRAGCYIAAGASCGHVR